MIDFNFLQSIFKYVTFNDIISLIAFYQVEVYMILENKSYTILDILKIQLQCTPIYSILTALQRFLEGIVPTLQVVITAKFIDTAVSVAAGKDTIVSILPSLFAVIALIGYTWISR